MVDLVNRQRRTGHVEGGEAVGPHLRVVTHPAQQPVGDPGSAAGPAGDLGRPGRVDPHAQNRRRTGEHIDQVGRVVEVQMRDEAEPVAQRAGQ